MTTENLILWMFLVALIGAFAIGIIYSIRDTHHIYHYHTYKKSKDYERLWDLLQQRWKVFVIYTSKSGTTWCDIARIHDYEYSDEPTLFGLGGDARDYWKPENKSKFIGYCMMRDYEFLDPADEVKEEKVKVKEDEYDY